ncbi:protoglobin domain-containing protein [Caldilinea sp.]|uniref:protoglobin domain-containing protein n=1 Tax=Caldilinea sp. TaxID=2293560 RepID=UPI00262E25D4|nr:protoglobin domain-containing protein [uncultured Caldilinea sp.]
MTTATQTTIPGYTYGQPTVAHSPISAQEFDLLKQTVLWSEEDERYLRMAGDVLADQVEDVLDLWYGFVGSHPHLLHYFTGPDGKPIDIYLSRVRARFGQWILDTCRRPYDQTWLDYQEEIALRHHSTRKNQTDQVNAPPIVPLRYMIAFIYPITATIRGFLAKKGHSAEEVEKMHQAWFKSIVLQVVLWSRPYAREGEF